MNPITIAAWVFAGVFILFPIIIFGGVLLSGRKNASTVNQNNADNAEAENDPTMIRFTQANPKKIKQSLIVKKGKKDVTKETLTDEVFGFGKANNFSLPTSGLPVLSDSDLFATPKQPLQTPRKEDEDNVSEETSKRFLLPPPPPNLK